MVNFVQKLVYYLNKPEHVANIQQYFGLVWKETTTAKNDESKRRKRKPVPQATASSVSEGESTDLEDKEYAILNHYWFWLFKISTKLGDEIFYASIFPFWFWNIDGAVGRRIIIIWALSMYIGQCLKDILCWVRPASPPVIRIEKKWALEYGMPSTHAMVSLTVPFSVIFLTASRYEYPVYVGIAIAAVWCILVSLSRLYLGMHSVADVVGGLLLAGVLLPTLLSFIDAMDSFLVTHPASPGFVITSTITMMLLYPGSKFSSAKEDTAVILGSAMGLLLGSWLSFQVGWIRGPPIPPPYPVLWPSYEMVGLMLLRTIIGLTVVVATRATVKSLSYMMMRGVALLLRKDKHNAAKESQVSDLEVFIKIGSKIITYSAIGFNVMCLAPPVFRYLDIERLTFHTEI